MPTGMSIYFCYRNSSWQCGSKRKHRRAPQRILPEKHRSLVLRARYPPKHRGRTQSPATQTTRLPKAPEILAELASTRLIKSGAADTIGIRS
jgi:IS30 family transposase